MKRIGVLVTALVLCVALGVTSLAFGATVRVKSKISLSFEQGGTSYSSSTEDTFFGKVKGKKGCKKNRTVKIVGTTLRDKTNRTGDYEISAGEASPGTYTAKVKKKVRRKGDGTRIVCKRATSNSVAVG